jgi:hypothetical protein
MDEATDWRELLRNSRPAGWVESEDEVRPQSVLFEVFSSAQAPKPQIMQDDGVLEEQFQPLSLPEYSNTWSGRTCSLVHNCARSSHKNTFERVVNTLQYLVYLVYMSVSAVMGAWLI